ncbi:MAG TPA: DUF418 domain-containing protein [Caldimonas sp.]|nr:DUF418 domain-containing protein [Caldimonas sp.]HEX2541890.1 DUF418 domain-containing protein [Caldimonas sp.]
MSAAADVAGAGPVAPVPAGERIVALDVLRGLALLGIFIMNMPAFSHSLFTPPATDLGAVDRIVHGLREALFAGKFNLLFGLLFGIGFTLQMRRMGVATAPAGAPAAAPAAGRALSLHARRLAALLAIGAVHAVLLWPGDVLVIYAVLGFSLLALRGASDRTVLWLLALCLLYPAGSEILRALLFSFETETIAAFEYQDFELSNAVAFGHGSFLDAVRETARIFAWSYTSPLGLYSIVAFYVQMATGILAGFLIGRRGWVEQLARGGGDLRRWQRVLLAVVVVGASIELVTGGSASIVGLLARTIERAALAGFYAVTVLRLMRSPEARRWLLPFAAAGRMPLSNYLLQTLLASAVFYGWGLGLWGRVGPAFETALAVLLFLAVQLPLSAGWLARFRYGPIEYLWRLLTYGRPALRDRIPPR